MQNIYDSLVQRKKDYQKSLAVLIDPDNATDDEIERLAEIGELYELDYFFVGGSLITTDRFESAIELLKSACSIPVVIFPGSNLHISDKADSLLFLSLISGRNPEYLIGQHVMVAPMLKRTNLEVISTSYLLVDCGNETTASYVSNTKPIPYLKDDIAAATALAGELLGHKITYLDGGSGAMKPISPSMILKTSSIVESPIVVGGGIRTPQELTTAYRAGADVLVVGTAIEENIGLLKDLLFERDHINQRFASEREFLGD